MRWLGLVLVACGGAEPEPSTTTGTPSTAQVCIGDDGGPTELLAAPRLQSVTTESAWILWDTPVGAEGSRVEYGPTAELGQVACGEALALNPEGDPDLEPSLVHEVGISGLEPGSIVHYRVVTGETASEVFHFKTAPDPADETSFRIVAMSDGQRDDAHPDKYEEVVHDGIIDHVHDTVGPDLAESVAFVAYPGDLVKNGWLYDDWADFFVDSGTLYSYVPIYPALGNHEAGTPHYFRSFRVPTDGVDEHYYTVDYSNLRLVTLDSNNGWDGPEQLAWLDEVLARTCTDPTIDFLFAQLHHPALSELWTPGESGFSMDVVRRLEQFSTDCAKPSIHFFGHTHGYSRGQSRDHDHLWVNVASAGGALDRWGEHPQADYDPFVASQDTYGFVMVEVEAGDAPRFTLSRISRGTPDAPVDNAVTDLLSVRLHNQPPATPVDAGGTLDACTGPAVLAIQPFDDPDGDAHQATHWQVAADCTSFDSPLVDRWVQRTNQFMGVDTQADDDLTDEAIPELAPGESACWRARVRDTSLGWSDWTDPAAFTLPSCP